MKPRKITNGDQMGLAHCPECSSPLATEEMRVLSSTFEQFTLGIEEEFQLVGPQTRELRSHVSEILEDGRMLLGEQVKPEMIQSIIEVGTGICKDIKEVRADITNLRSILSGLAKRQSGR